MEEPQRDIRLSSSRFSGFSDGIVLKRLERESNRLLLHGLFVAVLIHLALASLWTSHQHNAKALKPLSVELRIVPPRMTKPFKISRPQDIRTIQRWEKPFDPSTLPDADYSSPDSYIFDEYYLEIEETFTLNFNRPIEIDTSEKYVYDEFTPFLPRFIDTIKRYSEKVISLKEELLTVDDLEHVMSEQYKGLLLVNPNDPNALTGYLYIPHVYTFDSNSAGYKNISSGVIRLAQAVTSTTGIQGKVDRQLILGSNSVMRAPFLYIGISNFWEYLPSEPQRIADYVYAGGFVMLENHTPNLKVSPAEASLRQFIKDAFGSKARLEMIPNDHPIYNNLFQFEGGPPLGAELMGCNPDDGNSRMRPVPYLEGIFIDGRLSAIYTNKGYGKIWGGFTPSSKMGVNIVLYAMSQLSRKTVRRTDYTLESNINMIRSSFEPIHKEKYFSLGQR